MVAPPSTRGGRGDRDAGRPRGGSWWRGVLALRTASPARRQAEHGARPGRTEPTNHSQALVRFPDETAQQVQSSGQDEFAQEILEEFEPESAGEDLRGFEWRFLRRASNRKVSLLSSHQIRVLSPAFSPDGLTMVSSDDDGGLIFWDLVAERERGRSQAHGQRSFGRTFSPDGRTLATWIAPDSAPSEVMLWNLSTGRRIGPVSGIPEVVVAIDFLPDCRSVAVRTIDRTGDWSKGKAIFWDLALDTTYSRSQRSPIDCRSLAYSRDGRRLATAGPSGPITLRASEAGYALKTIAGSLSSINCLALSPDGRTLAASHERGLTTWDTDSGAELGSIKLPIMHHLFFSSDGDRLVGAEIRA